MAISIKDETVDQHIRYLCSLTGESMTRAVDEAVKERIRRLENAEKGKKINLQRQAMQFLKKRPKRAYAHNTSANAITDALWES